MQQALSHATRCSRLRLVAVPSAVPEARRHLQRVLRERGLDELSCTAGLLASELVTNAVRAAGACHRGAGPLVQQPIVLTIRLTGGSLIIGVWDANPEPPVRQDADLASERGRGLCIVDGLSSRWGHYAADGGKVVWCELAG